jgi:hypothetical protein
LYTGFQTIIFSRFGIPVGVAFFRSALRHLSNISTLSFFVNSFFKKKLSFFEAKL